MYGISNRACPLRQPLLQHHLLQDARVMQLPDHLAGVVIRADGRPARADRIEEIQLVKIKRCHFQQRKLRVHERGVGVVEEIVFIHGLISFSP